MKKRYERPSAYIEEFTPNEYVAACGDENKVYMFTCDAGGGKSGDVWLETNGKPGLQWNEKNSDTYLSGYHACGITHEAKTTDQFLDGYYVRRSKVQEVKVWRGTKGDNTHCTTNLNMKEWVTAKS
ncbi:hypothetical protein [Anaerostipes sp.]|uniref:hypothetical protein n=1 Tax=Anaerostipes sp. TaxID=1872530 RepID=UPI002E793DB4|nr:hypothetical protein [Anaerostipes sp.]MED9815148.1 hypothetical protein [Anaerostipes sp.]